MTLALGVIGHRDLRPEDLPAIEASVLEWRRLRDASFRNAPTTLLTPLAPGADQLCAWFLTKMLSEEPEASDSQPFRLRPVFPFGAAAYSTQVRSQEGEFHPGSCEWSFAKLAPDLTRDDAIALNHDWPKPPDDEDSARDWYNGCYRDAGHYIAENADILIALWDGVDVGRIGGTSDTVLYALSPACQEARAKAGRQPLEVHWLAIPRVANPHPAGEAFTWQRLSVPSPLVRPGLGTSKRYVRRAQIALPIALGLASVACSLAGYWLNLRPEQASDSWVRADSALTAISHLTLNSFDPVSPAPGALLVRLGRWLAVGFVLTTIAGVMNGLFRWVDGLTLWWVGRHEHDLVCGLGWRGRGLIVRDEPDKIPVIAVDLLADEVKKGACHRMGVPLVEGDATSAETLRKLGVSKLRCAFVACNQDETNMEVVHQLAKMEPRHDTICCVELDSYQRFEILRNALPEGHGADLRIFNAESVTSRMLLVAHPIDRFMASPGSCGAEVIVIGHSPMAEELVRHVLQQGLFEEGKDLALAWLTPDAASTCRRFVSDYPVYSVVAKPGFGGAWVAEPPKVWLDAKVLPRIRFFDLPPSEHGWIELFEGKELPIAGGWITSVIVAMGDPVASAAVTYALAPRLEEIRNGQDGQGRDITLACYFNTPEDAYRGDIEHALNGKFRSLPVRVFSDFMGDGSKQVLRGDEVDRVARRLNGIYNDLHKGIDNRRQETNKASGSDELCDMEGLERSERRTASNRHAGPRARVKERVRECVRALDLIPDNCGEVRKSPDFDERCDRKWRDTSEDDRDSSRQGGAHAWVKRRIRTRLRAKGLRREDIPIVLARIEHRRWCAYHLLKGFRPLTRIPSEWPSEFSPNPNERRLVGEWFGDKTKPPKKPAFKRARRHVDLIPWDDFEKLFVDEHAKQAELEHKKDIEQMNLLDLLLGTEETGDIPEKKPSDA